MTNRVLTARYCQSCGIPLDIENGGLSALFYNPEENGYCLCCWNSEEYKAERTLPEMVEIWAANTDWYNSYTGTDYTPEELREVFLERLPTLHRWRQKAETQHIHAEIIGRITNYVQDHIFEKLDMDEVIQMSGLSKYHFRDVFKKITGENCAGYIQRLRIEQIAHLLLSTELTLEEIAAQTNYQTKNSLSKAFKKQFGISTSNYKKQKKQKLYDSNIPDLPCEIKSIHNLHVLYVEVGGAYKNRSNYRVKWSQIFNYMHELGVEKDNLRLVSVSLDDPLITPTNRCRFYIGAIIPDPVSVGSNYKTMKVPNGKYAVFKHVGSLSNLHRAYREIYENWLPQSGYHANGTITFESYPSLTEIHTQEITTEIHIPIKKLN